jgi:hypothetical protein
MFRVSGMPVPMRSKCAPLGGGGFGEGRDGGLAVVQVVAGQGGQVIDDVAEAANRVLAGAGLAGGLGIGRW